MRAERSYRHPGYCRSEGSNRRNNYILKDTPSRAKVPSDQTPETAAGQIPGAHIETKSHGFRVALDPHRAHAGALVKVGFDVNQARFGRFISVVEVDSDAFAQMAEASGVQFVAQRSSQIVTGARVIEEDVRVFAVGLVAANENRAVGAKHPHRAELRRVLAADFHHFHALRHLREAQRSFGNSLQKVLALERIGRRKVPTRATRELQRAISRAAALQTTHAIKAQRVVIGVVVAQPAVDGPG